MKTFSRGKNVGSYLGVRDEKWSRKKDALLERLTKDTRTLKLDKENLVTEKNRRSKEVERLEEENNVIARQVKGLQNELLKKRTAAKEVFKKSDALKRKLVELLVRRRGLLNEIKFYEIEKASLSEAYLKVSGSLSNNVSTLHSTLKNMDFMKGEVRALRGKVAMLESEIPIKYRDRGNLDEKIERILNSLNEFYIRMQRVERTIKESYYIKNKKNG